nr:restriction endonuclease subunit S [uncultured Intestinibacter sp.]
MEYVNLKDYIETMESGKRPKGGAVNEGIPSLGGEHITSEGKFNLRSNKLKYVPEDYYNELKKGKIQVNDILVVKDGATTGKTAIVTEKFPFKEACVNEHLFLIRTKEELKAKYLYYYFLSDLGQHQILKDFRGATIGGISREFININLYIPNIEIQEKIIKILDKSQELIYKKKEQIFNLDELVKSRFIEMFGDTFLNTKSFEMKQIKDITQIIKGVTYKPEQVSDKGIIVLRSSNIQNSKFDLNDIVRIDKEINEKFLVKYNDIIMCNRNGSERLVGKVAKIPMSSEQMTFGTFMTIIRSPYFNYLFNFFQTEGFRRQIKMQTSVAINQISIPLLESVKVPLPPMELQNKFAEFTNQVDKLKFEMEKSLKELEDNFNSLMQKAFKGELF